jgi:hypothetical protein
MFAGRILRRKMAILANVLIFNETENVLFLLNNKEYLQGNTSIL